MRDDVVPLELSPLCEHILRTLLYFDIFNYPLRPGEVHRFLQTNHVDESKIENELENLALNGLVNKSNGFYGLSAINKNVERRLRGNERALQYMTLAKKQARSISKFPFVRAVLASGSLSKGYMDEQSDLDFFIITMPGRLWVARTLLVLYKRIFLFNSHKHFCVNYFVDTDHMEIEEKNLFTATELVTALPMVGAKYYEALHIKNNWVQSYFPNNKRLSVQEMEDTVRPWYKRILESVLQGKLGNWLEHYFMGKTLERWKVQYQRKYTTEDFQLAFKTKQYASKNHPKHYQKRIMERYAEKIKQYAANYNVHLEI